MIFVACIYIYIFNVAYTSGYDHLTSLLLWSLWTTHHSLEVSPKCQPNPLKITVRPLCRKKGWQEVEHHLDSLAKHFRHRWSQQVKMAIYHSIVHGSNVVRLGWHTTCQTPRHSIFSFSEWLAVPSFQTAEWHDVWLVSLARRSMTQHDAAKERPSSRWMEESQGPRRNWVMNILWIICGYQWFLWMVINIHDYLWIKWRVWGIEVINVPTWLDILRPKAFGPSKQLAVNLGDGGPIGTETPSHLD